MPQARKRWGTYNRNYRTHKFGRGRTWNYHQRTRTTSHWRRGQRKYPPLRRGHRPRFHITRHHYALHKLRSSRIALLSSHEVLKSYTNNVTGKFPNVFGLSIETDLPDFHESTLRGFRLAVEDYQSMTYTGSTYVFKPHKIVQQTTQYDKDVWTKDPKTGKTQWNSDKSARLTSIQYDTIKGWKVHGALNRDIPKISAVDPEAVCQGAPGWHKSRNGVIKLTWKVPVSKQGLWLTSDFDVGNPRPQEWYRLNTNETESKPTINSGIEIHYSNIIANNNLIAGDFDQTYRMGCQVLVKYTLLQYHYFRLRMRESQ